MKVNASICFLQLLLFAVELDGVSRWEQSFSDRMSREGKKSYGWQRNPPLSASRRDVRRVLSSKVSSDALHYGLAWASWRSQHNRSYLSSQEELERYVVWRSNTAYIQSHNSYADKFGFTLAMNVYGDMVCM